MKTVIIYYSQTGNTEQMAKAIQKGVKQGGSECDLIKMQDANPRRLYKYDLIGIGSCVLAFVPQNVSNFIKEMRGVAQKHVFSFCTHGTHPELYFPDIYPKLRKRGLVVIGMQDWYCSVYLPSMPKPYPTDDHPDKIDIQQGIEFGKQMVENHKRINAGEKGLLPPKPKWPEDVKKKDLDPTSLNPTFASVLKYHKDKCLYPKCRLCMENCPMNGIDLSFKKPVIAKPCIGCEFCTRICPTGALDSDVFDKATEKLAKKELHRFYIPYLDKPEKEGKFRPSLPRKKWGTGKPIFRSYVHPQWIIGKGLNKLIKQ